MKFEIKHKTTGDILFSCESDYFKTAIELAIKQKADLSNADLRSSELSNANLSFANLSYANLSYVIGFKFAPINIFNTRYSITILDNEVVWGCRRFTFEEIKNLDLSKCKENWNEAELEACKQSILSLISFYRK